MEILTLIAGWVGLFFVKKVLYAAILAFLQLLTRQLDYLNNKLYKIMTPISDLGFPRILMSFLLLVFSGFMLFTEFSLLNTSMVYYFHDAELDLFPNLDISPVLAITYISITLILGMLGLEWLGFRKLLLGILYEDKQNKEKKGAWSDLKKEILTPGTFFKLITGVIFLLSLFYFAHLQGEMAIEREKFINDGTEPTGIVRALLYALGFFVPVLASVTFMSFEIFVATITKALSLVLNISQKTIGIGYDISKRTIEFITSPMELVANKINLATNNRTQKYLSPIEVKTKSGELNEILLFKLFNEGNSIVDNISSNITEKIVSKIDNDSIDDLDHIF